MRALLRSVTGSPASIKGKAKQGKDKDHYSISDIASSWSNIRNVLAASAASSNEATAANANDHASTSKNKDHTSGQSLASLSRSIDIIVDGLVNEQSTLSSDDAGPCLEYVLTNNIFSNIAQAAVLDQPVGLLSLVIRAFDNLVILLGEAFVTFGHRSLNDLLHGCIVHENSLIKHAPSTQEPSNAQLRIKSVAEPYEEELASLACSLCSRIKTQPDLLPLFFHDKRLSYRSKAAIDGKKSTTIHVVQNPESPLSTSTSTTTSPASSLNHLSPRPSLSQCSSQASISSTTSASEESLTWPPPGSTATCTTTTTVESRQYTFLIFDFLIRLLHRHGRTGELARTGLLFVIDLAMSNVKVKIAPPTAPPTFPILTSSKSSKTSTKAATPSSSARRPKRKAIIGQSDRISLLSYIEDSDFTDVLSAGLGAAFAVLPSHLYVSIPGMSSHVVAEEATSPQSPGFDALDGPSFAIREHGITISTEPEVKECLELFVNIIEFAMDVTRKAPKNRLPDTSASTPQDTSQTSIASVSEKMQSLISSIRSSFGTVFLHNALLPRIIDAASPTAEDAAIIAVLTYINTLVSSLEPETPLFEEAMSALLARNEKENMASKDHSAMRDNMRRILSYSLSSHSGRNASSTINGAGTPTTSLSNSLQLCTLRLLHTLLEKADWSALELFNIQPCIGCTSFPFEASETDEEEEETAFIYPDEDESDQDSFIYPSEDDHRKSIAAFTANVAQTRSSSKVCSQDSPTLELFLQLVSNTAQKIGSSNGSAPVGDRKNLSRHSSKSSLDAPKHVESSLNTNMAFSKYIRQAEISIQRDESFVRGIAIISAVQAEAEDTTSKMKNLALKSPAIRVADMSVDSGTSSLPSDTTFTSEGQQSVMPEDRMIQHKLMLHLGLMAQLDSLLSTFFINEPAVNLALTRVLAKLAICPYRSLDSWLVSTEAGGTLQYLQSLLIMDKLGLADPATQDALPLQHSPHQKSDNSKVTDWLRQSIFTQRATHQDYENVHDVASNADTCILAKYASLLDEVQEVHRSQIKDFDRLLHERKQNMLFVDDLADAMHGDSASGSPMEASSSGWHSPFSHMTRMPGGLSSPTMRNRRRVDSSATEREYINSLSPYAAHVRETSSKHMSVRLPITAEEATNLNPMDGAPLSRFWSANSSHTNDDPDLSTEDTTVDTPRISSFGLSPIPERLAVNTNLMLLSDLKSPMTPDEGSERKYKEVQVNLSKYLDNLVILEESLKELVAVIIVRMRIGIDHIN